MYKIKLYGFTKKLDKVPHRKNIRDVPSLFLYNKIMRPILKANQVRK